MFKAKSTTKEARKIIQDEVLSYAEYDYDKPIDQLKALKNDLETFNCHMPKEYKHSDYTLCYQYAIEGNFAIWYKDQRKVLSKIYPTAMDWNNTKTEKTYAHLLAREYVNLLKKYKIE